MKEDITPTSRRERPGSNAVVLENLLSYTHQIYQLYLNPSPSGEIEAWTTHGRLEWPILAIVYSATTIALCWGSCAFR